MRLFIIPLCCVGILLGGCAAHNLPAKTQLEIRQIQSRDFDTCDQKLVMKSMMNVLQDDGYIIKNAVSDLGLLSAEKDIDVTNSLHVFLACMGGEGRWNKHSVLEASANVTAYENTVRVRINFQTKTFDNFGAVSSVEQVHDLGFYQEFFDKVHKGIFLQKENL
ncbi:MAG: hypothetical protein WC222_10010 [Parachlamydiales bacterium]|jgi:hypothetical protein